MKAESDSLAVQQPRRMRDFLIGDGCISPFLNLFSSAPKTAGEKPASLTDSEWQKPVPSLKSCAATAVSTHFSFQSDETDVDSGFTSAPASSTTSLIDTFHNYCVLNGRTYHNFNESTYWGPNDALAKESLDIGHQLFKLLLDGKLFLAPIGDRPKKVLDIGTGTGIWAVEFADAFPAAEVIGTDLSPTQPTLVPPNLRFELDDAQLDWTYRRDSVDFVHLRCLVGAISDWGKLYGEAFDTLKPGEWIEHVEVNIHFTSDDGTVAEGHILDGWSKNFYEAGDILGKTFRALDQSRELMKKAGFKNVVQKNYKVPVGPWSSDPRLKELGRWNLLFCTQSLEGWALYILTEVMKWKVEAVQEYLIKVKRALLERTNHAYYVVGVVYGQKPE